MGCYYIRKRFLSLESCVAKIEDWIIGKHSTVEMVEADMDKQWLLQSLSSYRVTHSLSQYISDIAVVIANTPVINAERMKNTNNTQNYLLFFLVVNECYGCKVTETQG